MWNYVLLTKNFWSSQNLEFLGYEAMEQSDRWPIEPKWLGAIFTGIGEVCGRVFMQIERILYLIDYMSAYQYVPLN